MKFARGSGNVFADFEYDDAPLRQLKAILAAEIIEALDEEGLSVRRAQSCTGIAAADFSRIRQVKLERFTVGRLMTVLAKLDQDVKVTVRHRATAASLQP